MELLGSRRACIVNVLESQSPNYLHTGPSCILTFLNSGVKRRRIYDIVCALNSRSPNYLLTEPSYILTFFISGVERRRIYDIVNVLESVEIIS